jgi:hypothetical protein
MTKLRNKVEELSLNNEYQLRLRDLNYKDKIKVSHVHTCAQRYHNAHSTTRSVCGWLLERWSWTLALTGRG